MFEQDSSTSNLSSTLNPSSVEVGVPELVLQEASELSASSGFSHYCQENHRRALFRSSEVQNQEVSLVVLTATLFCFPDDTVTDTPDSEGRGQHSLCPKGSGCEPFKFSPSTDNLNKNVTTTKRPEDSKVVAGLCHWLSSSPCQCGAFVSSDLEGGSACLSTCLFSPFFTSTHQPILRSSFSPVSHGLAFSLKDPFSQIPWQMTESGRILEVSELSSRNNKSPTLQPFAHLQYYVIERLILLNSPCSGEGELKQINRKLRCHAQIQVKASKPNLGK